MIAKTINQNRTFSANIMNVLYQNVILFIDIPFRYLIKQFVNVVIIFFNSL